ncbi:uncharacterized protein MEPE_00362 [Melanopsichium pennsylvanicum]|uniref:CASTOR ACT domain-containing protein n=2 Tax=Melanopsichium pennsylvanicum TaxID=63383 RepID=A0AAJ4XGH3_9BASI|nr:conserved hypothetical protein [Melanopsichium pennsylvanicum 4]SNX81657.1 uncharacterized protein MEPE_00362 [Melanopsichium pennsylvanicum]
MGGDINDKHDAEDWQSNKSHYPNLDGDCSNCLVYDVSSHLVLIQPGEYMLARLPPTSQIPSIVLDLLSRPVNVAAPIFCTVTRTHRELSILVSTPADPIWARFKAELGAGTDGCGIDAAWRAFRIRGPMEFHLVGVLLNFTKCLAERSISIFAVSTWDTDYICVKQQDFENACQALKDDGWNVLYQAD